MARSMSPGQYADSPHPHPPTPHHWNFLGYKADPHRAQSIQRPGYSEFSFTETPTRPDSAQKDGKSQHLLKIGAVDGVRLIGIK